MENRKLVIFDVDGTLVVTKTVFVQALNKEFGMSNIDRRWEWYEHTTDTGILEEIFEKKHHRKPSDSEMRRCINKMIELLAEYYSRDSSLFRQVAGAQEIITLLRNSKTWNVGIATGGWKDSALMKLRYAGIDVQDIPFASSSDSKFRSKIIEKCIEQSMRYYGVKEFSKIVSVGDGLWDAMVANQLNIGFVGINVADRFKNQIDCIKHNDFREPDNFIACLEKATIPVIKSGT